MTAPVYRATWIAALCSTFAACSWVTDDPPLEATAEASATAITYRGAIPTRSGDYIVSLRYEGDAPEADCYEIHSYGGGQSRPSEARVELFVNLRPGLTCLGGGEVVVDPFEVSVEAPGTYVAVARRAGGDPLRAEFVVPDL